MRRRGTSFPQSRSLLFGTVLAATSMAAGCIGAEPSDDEEALGEVSEALSIPLPSQATKVGVDVSDSELGDMESEEHQGIAACPRYWIWTTVGLVMRVPRGGSMVSPLQGAVGVPEPFEKLGYDHYGDGECSGSHFFVTLTKKGGGLQPVVLEFNEDLGLEAFARTEHAVAAVNPVDGMLYGQSGMSLTVYNRSKMRKFRWDPATCSFDCWKSSEYDKAELTAMRTIKLIPRGATPGWWHEDAGHLWIQGGAFSSNGVYYMTVDHAEGESNFTGAHTFDVHAFTSDDAADFPVPGVGDTGVFHVRYDGDYLGYRNYELEGVTVYVEPGENQHHVKLSLMQNDGLEDDNVWVHHFTSNETPRAAINDYWMKQPALW